MLLSNLALAFVTGIISSFGHCLGMCGGIVAIYSARQAAQTPAGEAQPGMLARITSFPKSILDILQSADQITYEAL
ncbi:MAG: sulfite exporter TauE/SafE family protein [Chloroflexi bacterium]|nr:sulfite exporter TauE/SafE family protein [Chloroflexota bacterium]